MDGKKREWFEFSKRDGKLYVEALEIYENLTREELSAFMKYYPGLFEWVSSKYVRQTGSTIMDKIASLQIMMDEVPDPKKLADQQLIWCNAFWISMTPEQRQRLQEDYPVEWQYFNNMSGLNPNLWKLKKEKIADNVEQKAKATFEDDLVEYITLLAKTEVRNLTEDQIKGIVKFYDNLGGKGIELIANNHPHFYNEVVRVVDNYYKNQPTEKEAARIDIWKATQDYMFALKQQDNELDMEEVLYVSDVVNMLERENRIDWFFECREDWKTWAYDVCNRPDNWIAGIEPGDYIESDDKPGAVFQYLFTDPNGVHWGTTKNTDLERSLFDFETIGSYKISSNIRHYKRDESSPAEPKPIVSRSEPKPIELPQPEPWQPQPRETVLCADEAELYHRKQFAAKIENQFLCGEFDGNYFTGRLKFSIRKADQPVYFTEEEAQKFIAKTLNIVPEAVVIQ